MEKQSAVKRPENAPQRVAIYIRVSTTHQVDRDSLPMQRRDLAAYSELMLGITDYEIFEDAGYSGKDTARPKFQEMMERIRKGEFSHVLVWKIDRISRNLVDFANMYEELKSLRVTFVSKNEQFDTSTAMGVAMLKIILVFAELERSMTSERVTATMISRASQGSWNGGRVPYGYAYDRESKVFSVIEDEAVICRKMRDDYLEYKSLVHTAQAINASGSRTRAGKQWSPTGVWIILSSPFYAGIYRYNRYRGVKGRTSNPEDEWVLVRDHHPAIFTVSEWETMTTIRSENARMINEVGQRRIRQNVYVFDGLLYCGSCGCKMVSTPGRIHADGFRTTTHTCPGKRKGSCTEPSVGDLIVGEFILSYILNMLNAKSNAAEITDVHDLETRLLKGTAFRDVSGMDPEGVSEFFDIIKSYDQRNRYILKPLPARSKKESDSELRSLRKEKEKCEMALERLQNLFLYSPDAISEKDFMIRKKEITDRLDEASRKLGLLHAEESSGMSDTEFIRMASHVIISERLKSHEYIRYKTMAEETSPEVLHEYMAAIIDNIRVISGLVVSITFKNGLTHSFQWQ